MAQEQGLDDRIALTAEKIRAGKTSLGIEFGSTLTAKSSPAWDASASPP